MAKVILDYVKNEDKIAASGKPWIRCSIKVNGKYYNGFGDDITKTWQSGKPAYVELYEEDYEGKTQYKFKRVEPDETELKINLILQKLTNIEKFLKSQFSVPDNEFEQKDSNSEPW